MSEAEKQTNSTDIEREIIAAFYYLVNEGFPKIRNEGEAGFQKVSEEIKTRFPQFSKIVRFGYDQANVEQGSEEIRDILRGLPREKKIWEQELLIRIGDAFDLAYKALNRNMLEIFNEEFPRPAGDNSLEAFEKLDKKFIELTVDKQSLSWEMGEKYIRSHMEVVYAWDVVLLISAFMTLSRESRTAPSELFCLMNQLGQSCGLLKTLAEDQTNLLKEAHSRIKQSKNAQKSRPNALDDLIEEIMIKNPKIKQKEMLAMLDAETGGGVIESITDEEIEWTDKGKGKNKGKVEVKDTPISALKDRMLRVRKKILSQ